MKNRLQRNGLIVLVACALLVTGCDKITNQSRAVQSVTKAAFEDTKSSWKDFFMYHPPVPDSLPQTRYCYQMQSDVVCYDSEQQQLTSKLVGYQDGENISWVQPGGGALGASGGEPIALRPIPAKGTRVAVQQNQTIDAVGVDTGPVVSTVATTHSGESGHEAWRYDKGGDVYRKATVPATDTVTVNELPKK